MSAHPVVIARPGGNRHGTEPCTGRCSSLAGSDGRLLRRKQLEEIENLGALGGIRHATHIHFCPRRQSLWVRQESVEPGTVPCSPDCLQRRRVLEPRDAGGPASDNAPQRRPLLGRLVLLVRVTGRTDLEGIRHLGLVRRLRRVHQASGGDDHEGQTPALSAPAPRAVANSLSRLAGSHVRMTARESPAPIMPACPGIDNNRPALHGFGHCGFRSNRQARFPSRIERQAPFLRDRS